MNINCFPPHMVPLNFFGSLQTIANFLGWGSIAANSATSAGLPISAWIEHESKWLKVKNKSITSQISSSCCPLALLLMYFLCGCKLPDFNKTWMKRMDKGLGQGMCKRCWLEQQCCHWYKRTCTAWTSLTALQTKHVIFFSGIQHTESGKRLAFTLLLHLPNGPISRKRMEANGWWR